jgi:hypothetical protein
MEKVLVPLSLSQSSSTFTISDIFQSLEVRSDAIAGFIRRAPLIFTKLVAEKIGFTFRQM